MAFQTNVLRDGTWVTETIDLQSVLKGNTAPKPPKKRVPKPPQCGILTRTIIESPVAHWILPVRLRSPQVNDVAFVGDQYVQIYELQKNGHLRSVIRKNDFGSRIQNAKVIGSFNAAVFVKSEEEDIDMSLLGSSPSKSPTKGGRLPPQLLLLVLESGESVFLFLRSNPQGDLEFVTSIFPSPLRTQVLPGFHLAVDPSSRYIALACASDIFMVYELESVKTLSDRYARNQPLDPVMSYRPRTVNGVIHKMEFLYPRPADPNHVILLLLVVKNGRTRLVTYEWELGEDLKRVLAEEKNGHRLPPEHQMPLLIIPLTVRTAFFTVSPGFIAICKDVLEGPPAFEGVVIENAPPSDLHHGLDLPLWTAWTRPDRIPEYASSRDAIYLAREDGNVIFLEIGRENILEASFPMGNLGCNVSGTFASLLNAYADILILGGDSGPGTIWQASPRVLPTALGTIPNWSPTVDFVTTDEFRTWNQEEGSKGTPMTPWRDRRRDTFGNPDRIFATTGRGLKGTVAEYRYGLQADIGLDLEYGMPVRRGWLLPADLVAEDCGYHVLLSMPDRTSALSLDGRFSEVDELEPETAAYDFSSRTLVAVRISASMIVQITERGIIIVTPSQNARHTYNEILSLDNATPVDASIRENLIALTTHTDTQFHLNLLEIQDLRVVLLRTFPLEGEATCLTLSQIHGDRYALVGLWLHESPWLASYSCDGDAPGTLRTIKMDRGQLSVYPQGLSSNVVASAAAESPTSQEARGNIFSVEALTSVVTMEETSGLSIIVAGTRSGEVITLTLSDQDHENYLHTEKFGVTAATVSRADNATVLICCNSTLLHMTNYDRKRKLFKTKHTVLVVDANDPSKSSGPITSVTVLDESLSEDGESLSLLLLSDTHILFAELQSEARAIPRHLPVGGTPLKMIYSHALECLIVAVKVGDQPTLKFVDPDTGKDLSKPSKKDGQIVDYISGLGNHGDRIHGLAEWEYKKENRTWRFILVSTHEGRLLVVSTEREEPQGSERGMVRYWTRYKKKDYDRPIYSVLGHADGLLFCAGTTIYWEILDDVEKKLKPMKQYELSSPATSLRVVNGKILALTTKDSLEIIDFGTDQTSGQMQLSHSDPVSRRALHMMEIAGDVEGTPESSVVLLCDIYCGIAGLWVPWRQPNRDCEVLFEADLPASIRKFRRGRTAPGWLQAQRRPQFGLIPSTIDGAEIFGMGIDGSLQHFALLNMEVWRLLRFIQNIACESPLFSLYQHNTGVDDDFDPEPRVTRDLEMHVNGDLLQRISAKRALEQLLNKPSHTSRYIELIDEIDDGRCTADFEGEPGEMKEQYLELGYDILDYFLAPVL